MDWKELQVLLQFINDGPPTAVKYKILGDGYIGKESGRNLKGNKSRSAEIRTPIKFLKSLL